MVWVNYHFIPKPDFLYDFFWDSRIPKSPRGFC